MCLTQSIMRVCEVPLEHIHGFYIETQTCEIQIQIYSLCVLFNLLKSWRVMTQKTWLDVTEIFTTCQFTKKKKKYSLTPMGQFCFSVCSGDPHPTLQPLLMLLHHLPCLSQPGGGSLLLAAFLHLYLHVRFILHLRSTGAVLLVRWSFIFISVSCPPPLMSAGAWLCLCVQYYAGAADMKAPCKDVRGENPAFSLSLPCMGLRTDHPGQMSGLVLPRGPECWGSSSAHNEKQAFLSSGWSNHTSQQWATMESEVRSHSEQHGQVL